MGLFGLGLALVAMAFFSLTQGARAIALADAWAAVAAFDPNSTNHRIIWDLRVPRTMLGLLVGAALGLSGAVLQGTTRNPLADPSILGINAGAALFVVIGVALLGVSQLSSYVWLALGGAGIAMVVVYAVASLGREGPTPIKRALAGAAITAALQSAISAILLTSPRTLEEVRFWQVGALAGRGMEIVLQVGTFIAVGVVLALATGRLLDGLSMGEDIARCQCLWQIHDLAWVGATAVSHARRRLPRWQVAPPYAEPRCSESAGRSPTISYRSRRHSGCRFGWPRPLSAPGLDAALAS